MLSRIDQINAGAEYRDGLAAGIECRRMCGAVDALGEAAGHDVAGERKGFGKCTRVG